MKQPELKTNRKTGSKILVVYYTGNEYDQAIEAAERQFGLKNERVAVIALPEGEQRNKRIHMLAR